MALVWIACALPALAAAQPASAVRTLFVGVDRYEGADSAAAYDLKGPVNDVALLKAAFRTRGLLPGDDPAAPASACPSPSPAQGSVTLLNGCATRQGIIDSWKALIAGSRPGDTLVFYFSGHGSHSARGLVEEGGQAVSTLVPTDARGPRGQGDLSGLQVKMLIDAATQRGRNVVTIFDSCESGTATRDTVGGAREIPPPLSAAAPARDPDLSDLPPLTPVAEGYRVHLASARRGEIARESYWRGEGVAARLELASNPSVAGGAWHGDFTMALVAAIQSHEAATFYDLATTADLWLRARWSDASPGVPPRQHPTAEGAGLLASFIQSGLGGGPIYRARWRDGLLVALAGAGDPGCARGSERCDVEVGAAGGLTTGSTFGVFATAIDALMDKGALGEAVVAPGAQAFHAPLQATLSGPPAERPVVWLRERTHVYGSVHVALAVSGGDEVRRTAVRTELAPLQVVDVQPATTAEFELDLESAALWRLKDGRRVERAVDLARIVAPTEAMRAREAIRRIANVRQLLALPATARAPLGAIWLQSPCDVGVGAAGCDDDPKIFGRTALDTPLAEPPETAAVAATCAQPATRASITCAPLGSANIPAGRDFAIYSKNVSDRDLHPYLFFVGRDYAITLLYPPPFGTDIVLQGRSQLVRSGRALAERGRDAGKLVLIMSDTALPAEVLQQSGLPRGVGCEGGALARLLCSARSGARDAAPADARVGLWSVTTMDLLVR